MELYHYIAGTLPVVISIPHVGTHVPGDILERFTPAAKQLPDTDWHVDRLYAFAQEMGIHILAATHSRYVIDLNRDPNGVSLYPGQFTTTLCPTTLFDGSALYEEGQEPSAQEIDERIERFWQPYHRKLASLIADLKQDSRRVVVFDAHSIASHVPTLFEGKLPDLNFGTDSGRTADLELVDELMAICAGSSYSHVLNGRFKGGYITRHYGDPAQDIHSIQLELAQVNYMEESYPFGFTPGNASKFQILLRDLLNHISKWAIA
jgi:N-formylglutamate deformylase